MCIRDSQMVLLISSMQLYFHIKVSWSSKPFQDCSNQSLWRDESTSEREMGVLADLRLPGWCLLAAE